MAHLLGAERLHLEFPTRTVFDEVTLGIDEGDRIGVVGRNGDGKSTLLKLLAGRIEPDAGRVTRRRGIRIGMLDQADVVDPGHTVAEAVVGGIDEHVWAGDPKVRDVIGGLLADVPWHAQVGSLSGGQRRRVGLAALLVGDWDVVFLDEPTNHLDVEGIAWLAGHLKRRWSTDAGALVVVTHDRWFLDEVCTDTWEVHDGIVEPFEGGYAAYVLQRVERDRMAAASEAKRQNLMRKELAWLRRGAPARTSKPKFRIDAANELYLDQEQHDGYLRDRDVFDAGITIEDNLAALVDYDSGATMSYSLNAHAPWEGYRVTVNGTEGRAELEVVERGAVLIGDDGRVVVDPSMHPDASPEDRVRPDSERLVVQRHWEGARVVPIPEGIGSHGGGDAYLLQHLFDRVTDDAPLGRVAGYADGVKAVSVGIAGNLSLATGEPVRIADLELGV
ncbi:ATP-binding cassette domain-containing protein [Agromyces humi]|uniref:ATP-binding cassette domain-containing protein n=1 Tax=Agromyces humi TaxID=1766800 RepID=UPI0038B35E7F